MTSQTVIRPLRTSTQDAPTDRFVRDLGRLALAIILAAALLAVWAALERRAFHADGVHFFVRLLTHERFDLVEPSRRAVMFAMQAPALIAIRLDLVDLDGAAFVYCLTLELLPLVLVAACYAVLPADRKHFFFFPLLHYLAGTLAAAASPVTEAPVATAYFWLVLCTILFRRLGPRGFVLLGLAALPAAVAHEAMVGLAPALALAALWRMAGADGAGWRGRAYLGLAAWFGIVAAIQAGFVLFPRSADNRGGLIEAWTSMWWLIGRDWAVNVPAWLGLFAILALNLLPVPAEGEAKGRCARSALVFGFAALAVAGVAAAAIFPQTVYPEQHFFARVYPAIVSLGLLLGLGGTLLRPHLLRKWASSTALAICAMLAASTLAWHAIEIRAWSIYAGILRDTLAVSRGIVAPGTIEARLDPTQRKIFRNMTWDWTLPAFSLVLSPQGRVRAIIAPLRNSPWVWNLRDPAQIPRSRFFDISAYRAALSEDGAVPPAR